MTVSKSNRVHGQERGLGRVGREADEADLSGLLRRALDLEQLVGDLLRAVTGVQVPDIEVIGCHFLQAGVDLLQRLVFRSCLGFCGEDQIFSLGFQSRTYHALIVPVLVAARRIEVINAQIRSALDDALNALAELDARQAKIVELRFSAA
jgi:hypothetical protein